jgi:diaminohydroxyphosphoribosylaminopyrimidine deaminase/5-amino-6-(5-phosphoribosylamino)uracil reductase
MSVVSEYSVRMGPPSSNFPPLTTLSPGYTLGGWLPLAIRDQSGKGALDGLYDAPTHHSGADQDRYWMHQALVAAMAGVGLPSPNPNVGCVLVRDGQELSRGGTAKHGGLHGEAQALALLPTSDAAQGATAYVTLEPCAHFGKQPPCADALVKARIARCVFASWDPHPLVSGRGSERLKLAGVKVEEGPLRRECRAWNLPFFFQLAYKRPLVVGKWAQTLNGQMADQGGGSQWISGPLARRYVHWLRQKYDAIMVGAGTALADGPDLTARDTWGPMRQPLKIVFDPSGRLSRVPYGSLPEKVRTRTLARATQIVYVGPDNGPARAWAKQLEADVFYVAVPDKDQAFPALMTAVMGPAFVSWYGSTLQSIFVEGGAALHNHLLATDCYDAFHVFVTPSFISADQHRVGSYGAQEIPMGFSHVASMKRYELLQTASLGPDVLMEFLPKDRYERIFG